MAVLKHLKWHHTIDDRVQALGLATVTAGGADWSRDTVGTAPVQPQAKDCNVASAAVCAFFVSAFRNQPVTTQAEFQEPRNCSARHLIEYLARC